MRTLRCLTPSCAARARGSPMYVKISVASSLIYHNSITNLADAPELSRNMQNLESHPQAMEKRNVSKDSGNFAFGRVGNVRGVTRVSLGRKFDCARKRFPRRLRK